MPDEPVCRLLLPIPPSTNNNTRNKPGGGRSKTAHYKAWIAEAGWEIKLQRPPALHPPLRVCLRVLIEAPLGAHRDIDNIQKPILDLLKTMGVYADDRLVDDLHTIRTAREIPDPAWGRLSVARIEFQSRWCTVSIWPI